MSRPKRSKINNKSLEIIGIPLKFRDKNISDFNSYDNEALENVKTLLINFIDNIQKNIKENKGLLLYGSNGVGKTFLSSLVLKEAYINRFSCSRITFSSYCNKYTSIWNIRDNDDRAEAENELLTKYKTIELLVIEELGKEIDSKISSPILEDLLRYREDNNLTTIITTNLQTSNISDKYGVSIFSIIKGNMLPVKITGVDRRKENFK